MSDPQGTFAWLVEEFGGTCFQGEEGEVLYQTARGWSNDPCAALRYARREDAQAVVDASVEVWASKGIYRQMRAAEHGFAPIQPISMVTQ